MKRRPIRVRPEFYAIKTEAPSNLPAILDGKAAASVGAALCPTQEQYIEIIKYLCERKNWTISYLATLLNCPQLKLTRVMSNTLKVDGVLGRLLWMFYIMDVAPGHLLNPSFILSWGRTSVKIPRVATDDEDKAIESVITKAPSQNIHMTASEIQKACASEHGVNVSVTAIRRVCKKAKYTLRKLSKGLHLLRPNSLWLQVDWSKSNPELARTTGMSLRSVVGARTKLRNISREELVAVFQNAGRPIEAVDALLRTNTKYRKVKNDTSEITEPSSPSI